MGIKGTVNKGNNRRQTKKGKRELLHTVLLPAANFIKDAIFWALELHQVKQRNKEHTRHIKSTHPQLVDCELSGNQSNRLYVFSQTEVTSHTQ